MLLEEPQGRNCIKNYDLNLWKTRWLRWLCYLHKVLSTKLPTYLYELIPPIINFFCNPCCYRALYCRTDLFQNSFLPFSINKWNKLDPDIRNLDSHKMFRKKLFNFIRPSKKSIFNIYDPQRFKLPSRLRLGFSHYVNTSSDITLQILWICYAHVFLRLKAQIIFFYDAKIMYHFVQPLWMN